MKGCPECPGRLKLEIGLPSQPFKEVVPVNITTEVGTFQRDVPAKPNTKREREIMLELVMQLILCIAFIAIGFEWSMH